MNTIILKGIKKTTFWGSGFFMELLLILFVLASMRQNTGSASEIDLIYILQKKHLESLISTTLNNLPFELKSLASFTTFKSSLYNYIDSS